MPLTSPLPSTPDTGRSPDKEGAMCSELPEFYRLSTAAGPSSPPLTFAA